MQNNTIQLKCKLTENNKTAVIDGVVITDAAWSHITASLSYRFSHSGSPVAATVA